MGLAVTALLMAVWTSYGLFAAAGPLYLVAGTLLILLSALTASILIVLLLALPARLPVRLRFWLAAAIILAAIPFSNLPLRGVIFLVVALLLLSAVAGALVWTLVERRGRPSPALALTLIVCAGMAVLGLSWLLGEGFRLTPVTANLPPPDSSTGFPTSLPDPTQPGAYEVDTFTYGSGTDRHRPEFGAQADIVTEPVDARSFVTGWSPLRTRFWGFDQSALPVNGRVWYPDGAGPFPLVLMVHGNHNMADFSDPGYGYLGELLASHGFIAVSVDQNFLNGSAVGDMLDVERLRNENDARAWLLLQHLVQWRAWQHAGGHPLAGMADMDSIGLIGHSRGGEAVAVAALFNRLSRYPENARLVFDFGFGLRAVAAIAPVDGQYLPGGQPTPVENVSYFVLHGSHDGDVTSFAGLDQYARISFSDGNPDWFKAALYVYRANHGQFNSTWGALDRAGPHGYLLERAELLSADEQQQIAAAYLSAFMTTMLIGEADYRPLFQNPAVGAEWLPDTIYLAQYRDPADRFLATFEEDVDVLTGTVTGTRLLGTALTTWRERAIRSKGDSRQDHAVYLGWNRSGLSSIPAYTLSIPAGLAVLESQSEILFSVADSRKPAADLEPIDFTIELTDTAGARVTSSLSTHRPLSLPLVAYLVKSDLFTDLDSSEPVLSGYRIPLSAFDGELDFRPEALVSIRFLFDRSPVGEIILDSIGWR